MGGGEPVADGCESTQDADDYPRVLVVGQTFESLTGGGITLSSLFSGWPKERLAGVASLSAVLEPGVCEQYYVLGPDEDRFLFPLSLVPRRGSDHGPRRVAAEGPLVQAGGHRLQPGSMTPLLTGRQRRRFRALRVFERLGAAEMVRQSHVSPALVDWVQTFAPDVVYTQLATLNVIRLVGELDDALGIPLVVHFMDDWPSVIYRRGLLAGRARRLVLEGLRDLVGRAGLLLAIGDAMAAAFAERYGRPLLAFQNAIDVESWARQGRAEWSAGSPFTVTYTGRVGTATVGSLRDLCVAVSGLAARGLDIELVVYSYNHAGAAARKLARMRAVRVLPPVPYEQVPSTLARSDLLVLPLDFDEGSVAFARYSMPTKTPEYMASGVPTVVYAPPSSALAAYAVEDGWAEVVRRPDVELLAAAVARLAADEDERRRLGTRAREVARRRHDGSVVRKRFRECLCAAGDRAAAGAPS